MNILVIWLAIEKPLCDCFDDCDICMEPLTDEQPLRSTNCGHLFHKICMDKWLKER